MYTCTEQEIKDQSLSSGSICPSSCGSYPRQSGRNCWAFRPLWERLFNRWADLQLTHRHCRCSLLSKAWALKMSACGKTSTPCARTCRRQWLNGFWDISWYVAITGAECLSHALKKHPVLVTLKLDLETTKRIVSPLQCSYLPSVGEMPLKGHVMCKS